MYADYTEKFELRAKNSKFSHEIENVTFSFHCTICLIKLHHLIANT